MCLLLLMSGNTLRILQDRTTVVAALVSAQNGVATFPTDSYRALCQVTVRVSAVVAIAELNP